MALNTIGATGSPVSAVSEHINTGNLASQIRSMAPEAQKILWANTVELGVRRKRVWLKHSGASEDKVLWSGRNSLAGNGRIIRFKNGTVYSKDVQRGETLFTDPEMFNREHINTYQLRVSLTRLAHAISDEVEPEMGMANEILDNRALLMGQRAGEKMDEDIDMMFLLKAPAENVVFAHERANFDALTVTDTFGIDDATFMRYYVGMRGKAPKIGTDSQGNEINKYLLHCPQPGTYGLRSELIDRGILLHADQRGAGNMIFTGGIPELDGQVIEERPVPIETRQDALGCPLAPFALLGRTLTDGTVSAGHGGPAVGGATEVWGGINYNWTNELYNRPMRQFPGWDYVWGDTLTDHSYSGATANTPGQAPKYAILFNLAGADKGKWNMVSYSAIETTHARYLTVTNYLRASTGGLGSRGVAQVGSVIWDANKNTTTHTMGMTAIIPCTSKGVPYCYILGLGAGAGMWAYGAEKNQREVARFDALIDRTYVRNTYGQALRYDAGTYVPSLAVMVAAVRYPYMDIQPTLAS